MQPQPRLPNEIASAADAAAALADIGIVEIDDKHFMLDSVGRLVPLGLVKPQHKLEDQVVRDLIGHASKLSAQISRFREHTFNDVTALLAMLAEQYGAARGGKKGNITLVSFDGTQRVTVQVADQLTFGPELQIAKDLVDACITVWAKDASDNIRVLVEHAFQVDKEGRINRSALFALRRLEIEDPQWLAAMRALGDAIRVIGTKEYVRFYRRAKPHQAWEPIVIDLAGVS